MIAASVILAIVMDMIIGEPKRWHPLVGFGYLATTIESQLNREKHSVFTQQLLGIVSWVVVVIIPTVILMVLLAWLQAIVGLSWVLEAIILYLAIGYNSLRAHALSVLIPLQHNNLPLARQTLAMIVSRDTGQLDDNGVRKATIESVLENGSDAIFAPLFWFLLGGAAGVIIYRLANTLDAMWGYKTSRFLWFGRFSARMDDILNWLPSRLVGLSYALFGHTAKALTCWRTQAHRLESPNGGVVMSCGAGALTVCLGGEGMYHGRVVAKPVFGCGAQPNNHDISRTLSLIDKTLLLWCLVISGYGVWQWLS